MYATCQTPVSLKNINIMFYNLEEEWNDDTDGGNDNDEGKLCYLYS